MENQTNYHSALGIDVCAQRLDLYLLPTGKTWSMENTVAGLAQLMEQLEQTKTDITAIEAAGGLQRLAVSILAASGWELTRWSLPTLRHYYQLEVASQCKAKFDLQRLLSRVFSRLPGEVVGFI